MSTLLSIVKSPIALAALGFCLALPATALAAPIAIGPGLISSSGADSGERLNVAEANTQLLSGDYVVSSFYF